MLEFCGALIMVITASALSHGFDWGLLFGLLLGIVFMAHKLIYNIVLIHVRKSVNAKRK